MSTFDKTRLQFLPAALEIQASPPHPLARFTALNMMLFFLLALLWLCIGTVDVVSVAEGKIIPSARVKQIQPLEKGVVKTIFVCEGQQVNAGDALVAMDRTGSNAQRERLANELHKTEESLVREQGFLALLENAPEVSQTALQKNLLEQQWKQYQAQQAVLQNQSRNHAAEQQGNKELIHKLQATLPIASKRANDMKQLAAKKLVAEHQYLELEEQRINQQQDLAIAQARDSQLTAAMAESDQQIMVLSAQTRAQTLSQIVEAERQVSSLREQLEQAQDIDEKQVLYAPVSGKVKDLAVNTVGGVVLEAQQLMLIVPDDERLEVEAWLPNQDIGFVQEQEHAIIKIHTFPFTRYGTIDAIVTRVSDDAIEDEKTARAKGGLLFGMSLLMAKNTLQIDGREVKLMPGMQVTAEIITGQRRIIEYFFTPLQQHMQESVRER